MNLPFPPPFTRLSFELEAFAKYLSTLEKQLPAVKRSELKRYEDLLVSGQCEDVIEEDTKTTIFIENVVPRFFYNQLLLTLWAIFESAIVDISTYVKDKKQLSIGLKHIRGNFLKQVELYFEHVLNFPLHWDEGMRLSLRTFMTLRHAIAHGNGLIGALNKNIRNKIFELEKANIGISVHLDSLLISEAYLHGTYAVVHHSLQYLVKRVVTEYPNSE